jgi:vacuolar-type H+-ATPase catalytic subunit A/Vma1
VDIANHATTEEKGEEHTLPSVEKGRKRVRGIMASILAARTLAQYDVGKRVATMSAIADAGRWAEAILKEIDERWPGERKGY